VKIGGHRDQWGFRVKLKGHPRTGGGIVETYSPWGALLRGKKKNLSALKKGEIYAKKKKFSLPTSKGSKLKETKISPHVSAVHS